MSETNQAGTNQAWESPVKKRLRQGEPVIAVTITTANVDVAAHAASMGFDFLWIETEHSPITLETLRNMVLATRGMKALPFARVPVNELWMAKRVLDAGVCGVIFPFTSTVPGYCRASRKKRCWIILLGLQARNSAPHLD